MHQSANTHTTEQVGEGMAGNISQTLFSFAQWVTYRGITNPAVLCSHLSDVEDEKNT